MNDQDRKVREMKPCPACSGTAAMLRDGYVFAGQDYGNRYPVGVRTQQHGWQIRCNRCGLQTCWWHYEKEATDAWNRRALELAAPEGLHPDDIAVEKFAAAMKAKMAKQRAKGYGGWDDPADCAADFLRERLLAHVGKGDPVDVGNFAMMLFNRGESTAAPKPAATEGKAADEEDAAFRRGFELNVVDWQKIVPPPSAYVNVDPDTGEDRGPCCAYAYDEGFNECRRLVLDAAMRQVVSTAYVSEVDVVSLARGAGKTTKHNEWIARYIEAKPAADGVTEAIEDYLAARDALDNHETSTATPDYGPLQREVHATRRTLEAALAAARKGEGNG